MGTGFDTLMVTLPVCRVMSYFVGEKEGLRLLDDNFGGLTHDLTWVREKGAVVQGYHGMCTSSQWCCLVNS